MLLPHLQHIWKGFRDYAIQQCLSKSFIVWRLATALLLIVPSSATARPTAAALKLKNPQEPPQNRAAYVGGTGGEWAEQEGPLSEPVEDSWRHLVCVLDS